MSEHDQDDEEPLKEDYWLDKPSSARLLYRGLWVVCAGLAVADLLYHRHTIFAFEGIPAIYGLYGFVCFFGIVIAGKYLRKLVGRKEDYYDR